VRWLGLLLLGGVLAGAYWIARHGSYGFTLFLLIPFLAGAAGDLIFRPRTVGRAAGVGILTGMAGLLLFFGIGLEGGICIVMAAPLAAPLGALGAVVMHSAMSSQAGVRGGAAMLLLLPPSLIWDTHAVPDLFAVHTRIEIAATPEQVWKHVVSFSELPEPHEWFFHAGLAYPQRARIDGAGPGAIRYCEFSTGPFVEPIEVWEPPRLLQFRVTENPAPMHEWSPYAHVLPKHLHGYLVSRRGEFRISRIGDRRVLLEGTTWYQHGLWPGTYWRWWSDAIIHRIHLRVLNHIRMLAEAESAP
jgi:hypothetical protein